jgi:hypothetical protein
MDDTTIQSHAHAVVWIDRLIAKIFSIGVKGVHASTVRAHLSSPHLHHKANTIGSGRIHEDSEYVARVSEALDGCTDLLIIGPGTEKTELMRYLQAVKPEIRLCMEPSDHPTDGEIVALGRKHFRFR